MRWLINSRLFNLFILLGLLVLILSIYDIIMGEEWMVVILAAFAVLIIIILTLIIYLSTHKEEVFVDVIEEFEKTLKGGLYHFKCPTCTGIFAIKKSKSNDDKIVKMTCPDCGAIGVIPPNPISIEEEIPEKKSVKANFRCNVCGEGVTIWAEGTTLYKNVIVYSCPYCGEYDTMKRV